MKIEELQEMLDNGEAIILPSDRKRQETVSARVIEILRGKVLSRKELLKELGFRKHTSTINYLEKKGKIKALHIKESNQIHYCLTEELQEKT